MQDFRVVVVLCKYQEDRTKMKMLQTFSVSLYEPHEIAATYQKVVINLAEMIRPGLDLSEIFMKSTIFSFYKDRAKNKGAILFTGFWYMIVMATKVTK